MSWNPNKTRIETILLLGVVVVLGSIFAIRQPRLLRLEAAHAGYQRQYNQRLEVLLDLKISLTTTDSTSLADFVERIKQRYDEMGYTRPGALAIVVDAVGIQQVNRSLSSIVQIPEPGGLLPLGDHLRLALEPMGLGIVIKEGSIVITSQQRVYEDSTAEDANR